MDTTTTRENEYTARQTVLYLAFELGWSQWKLGFSIGLGRGHENGPLALGIWGHWSMRSVWPRSGLTFPSKQKCEVVMRREEMDFGFIDIWNRRE